ncbi:AAA domain (dynein-related subfamily)/ATPase family associated with various cellular activities (AAA), putative [Leishmania shawi]|uniref:AAA domain (Dynein-related subfamily) n=1 Tax=Leishmania shawi TaxID=5680 RepID=A0ABR3E092_9TRYP
MDSYVDLLNLNFMYSLRTGNLLTDMMIAALLPLVSSAIAYLTRTWWPQLVSRVLSYFANVDSTSATFKTLEHSGGLYYGHTLRVALSTYVTKVLKPRFDVAELKYISIPGKLLRDAGSYTEALRDYCFVDAGPAKELPMRLTTHLELKQSVAGDDNNKSGRSKGEGRQGEPGNSVAAQESLFTITQYKHSFSTFMRGLCLTRANTTEASEASEAVAQLERDANANGDAIQSLLERSLEHYRFQYKEATKRTERYLYQPLLTRQKLGFGALVCNCYPLRSEKTFQSLFFPAKPRLIKLIDDFEKKTGKYAIPGYPQKLVLLLYGPPGTGKTSLAKAVAAYTKRDLFAISLSRIRNDEELIKCMFSGRFKVKEKQNDSNFDNCRGCRGSNDSMEVLDPAKLVYILEDVDATTAIVLKDESEEGEGGGEEQKQQKRRRAEVSTTSPLSSDTKSSDRVTGENSDAADVVSSGKASTSSEKALTKHEMVKVTAKNQRAASALTIEGLTKALNGVLDFPQRIVIMTTNHIEKLHPSLLRPGVVTMKLHMHNFDAACAVAMVEHYFSHTTLLPAQLEELRSLLEAASVNTSKLDSTMSTSDDSANSSTPNTKDLSPAELELRCAECDTIEELLEVLRQGSRVNIF